MEEGAAAYASEAAADFSVAVAQQKELKRLQDLQVCLLYVDLQVCLLYRLFCGGCAAKGAQAPARPAGTPAVCLSIHPYRYLPPFFIDIRSKKSSSACKTCRDAYYMSVHTCRYLVFFLASSFFYACSYEWSLRAC